MPDVLEHRGQVRALVTDQVEKLLLHKDVFLAVVLLHIRGEVVQDVFLQFVLQFTRAYNIWGAREKGGSDAGRTGQARLTPHREAGPCDLASVETDWHSQTLFQICAL